jgi:regulatory protein
VRRGRTLEPSDGRRVAGEAIGDAEPDPESVARAICLRQLTGAPRTRAELATALRKKGVPDDVATAVLDRFVDVELIDDAAYADSYVGTRHRERGLARSALRSELRRKGVDHEVAREAVEQIDPETELATARALVARKLAATRGLPAEARVRRLAGMLARKGYPAGTSYRVVREALQAEGTDVPDQSADLASGDGA